MTRILEQQYDAPKSDLNYCQFASIGELDAYVPMNVHRSIDLAFREPHAIYDNASLQALIRLKTTLPCPTIRRPSISSG